MAVARGVQEDVSEVRGRLVGKSDAEMLGKSLDCLCFCLCLAQLYEKPHKRDPRLHLPSFCLALPLATSLSLSSQFYGSRQHVVVVLLVVVAAVVVVVVANVVAPHCPEA